MQMRNNIFKKLKSVDLHISELYPSEWAEKNRIMTKEVSPISGPYSYENSPYIKELVNTLDQRTPGNVFALMGGAQIGKSVGLIENGIGWIIANNPGNILFLVGHADVFQDSVRKIDIMIENTGLIDFIGNKSKTRGNAKTGNTDSSKEFPMGKLKMGLANHKMLRNFSAQYGFIDDVEAMKGSSEDSGSTEKLIDQRFAAYSKSKKLWYISTPELEDSSNIYAIYLKGDQRKYHVECSCCSKLIVLEWEIESKKDGTRCGIVWDLNDQGVLIAGSVRYRCQECNGEFDDRNKKEMLQSGKWIPTAVPKIENYRSYHISALYAPVYMDGWEKYVNDYLDACPPGGERNEAAYKTFRNLVLGLPYKMVNSKLDSKKLMESQRNYEPLLIPQSISENDGNGKIVMVTMAADIGGTELDARIDYEIIAWSESGASYSIDHGSIGTYQPREKLHIDRLKQPIDHTKENNVWVSFMEIMLFEFDIDNDVERKLNITAVGVDHGHMGDYVEEFYNYYEHNSDGGPELFMVKGLGVAEKIRVDNDEFWYKNSKTDPGKLFILKVNVIKTALSNHMSLIWREVDDKQPPWYMNFPKSVDGKYSYGNFFSHFEAEERIIDGKTFLYVWKKKSGRINHQFDCRVYNMAVREIFINELIFKPLGLKRGNWNDYVSIWNSL